MVHQDEFFCQRRRRNDRVSAGPAASLIALLSVAACVVDIAGPSASGDDGYWQVILPMHPKIVHLPIALTLLMPILVLGVLVAIRWRWLPRRVFAICVALQLLTFATGVGALISGHEDAIAVEGYATDEALQAHDQRAHWFLYVAGINAALACLLLVMHRRRHAQDLIAGVLLAGLAMQVYAGYLVGDAGGRLVYVGGAAEAHR